MSLISKWTVCCLLALFAGLPNAFSQAAKSPISSFGIGELYGNALVNSQGMGGVGISNPQLWYLNNINPALLVFNRRTTIGAGFLVEQRRVSDSQLTENHTGGNLNYLNFGFPVVRNRWAAGLGLAPYSSVNYKLQYTGSLIGSPSELVVTEEGTGGINQVFWSNGVVINRNISVGAKATYLFGSIIDQYTNQLGSTSFAPSVYERQHFSNFNFTTGISFHTDSVFNKFNLNLGAVYEFQSNVNTDYYARLERRNSGIIIDSLTVVDTNYGTTTLPSSLGVGASLGTSQWLIGADVTFIEFSRFKNYFGTQKDVQDVFKYALGAELTPNAQSSNYFNRMTYRVGGSLTNSPYLVNDAMMRDFGINFGLAFPVNTFSSLDVALKVGRRGDINTNDIVENYFKLYFGVTFNDQWFIKRVFE